MNKKKEKQAMPHEAENNQSAAGEESGLALIQEQISDVYNEGTMDEEQQH
ncbi:YozQ family protein [Bacillus xiapuensis]|nr:YozQ family protein [Bacillus xiapuensis]